MKSGDLEQGKLFLTVLDSLTANSYPNSDECAEKLEFISATSAAVYVALKDKLDDLQCLA